MTTLFKNSYFIYFLTVALGFLSFFSFKNPNKMPPQFLGAFHSGYQNIHFDRNYFTNFNTRFQIDANSVQDYVDGKTLYPKNSTQQTKTYHHNNVAFIFFVAASKLIFWESETDQKLVWFQMILHLIMSIFILSLFDNFISKYLFIALYAANPFIIYFVSFPYYYFGLILVSFVFLMLSNQKLTTLQLLFFVMLIAWATNLRQTAALATFFSLYLIYQIQRFKKFLPIALTFVIVFFLTYSQSHKNFRYTAFLGMGAYDNDILNTMEDAEALVFFEAKTGKEMNSANISGNYYNDTIQNQMSNLLFIEVQNEFKAQPYRFFRNAFLNIINSFSVGYLNDFGLLPRLISFILGILSIAAFLYFKLYNHLIFILLMSAPVVLYYPPVQVYVLGNFIILAHGWSKILPKLLAKPFQLSL
ncbi:MAG: hypothetical protein H6607_10030 [Flavobacteriales bacterium]|nr:hypothetical protein [Flavobacteriales bacterium]